MDRRLAGGTLISWAHYTFNPWRGCVKVSPACRMCYAERDTARWGGSFWGKNAERRITKSTWGNPRKWNRDAEDAGEQRRVFAASLADVFEDRDDLVDARNRMFDLVEETPWLIWMLLTKRPESIAKLAARYASGWPPNVWLGCSAETQRFADERIPHLVQHPVPVRFVSTEPTLGALDLTRWLPSVNWVISGGESGHQKGIRASHPTWYRGLRDQCQTAGVAYHHKQNGMWVATDQFAMPDRYAGQDWAANPQRHTMLAVTGERKPVGEWDGSEDLELGWTHMVRVHNKNDSGRLLDGKVWSEFPTVRVA